jgi:hypothetical protein
MPPMPDEVKLMGSERLRFTSSRVHRSTQTGMAHESKFGNVVLLLHKRRLL